MWSVLLCYHFELLSHTGVAQHLVLAPAKPMQLFFVLKKVQILSDLIFICALRRCKDGFSLGSLHRRPSVFDCLPGTISVRPS